MNRRENVARWAYFFGILILLLALLISGLRILESTVFSQRQVQVEAPEKKTIVRNGVEFFPRQDITVMLVMGIDQSGPVKDSGFYRNSGAADLAMLLIFDEKNEDFRILYLNRDTMVNMNVLGLGGKKAGTTFAQLAMAHTYGSGLEDSCENTLDTISGFLNGIRIDYYVSMNMDAISLLNDAVGGVTVQVEEDFSRVDPSITMGTMTLRGDQAISYVRSRKDVGDQLNISRIQRQKGYIQGFVAAFREAMEADGDFVLSAYESVAPYLITDCTANTISGMFSRYGDFELQEIVTPEGENVLGEEYYEFHVDEEKLDALILRLFYSPK